MEYIEIAKLIGDLSLAALVVIVGASIWASRDKNEARSDGILEQALKLFAGLSEVIQANTQALEKLARDVSEQQILTARVHRDMQSGHSAQRVTSESVIAAMSNLTSTFTSAQKTMAVVTQQRNEQHDEIMTALQPISDRIDEMLKQITIATDENTLRHEMSKMALLLAEVKRICEANSATGDGPGEAKQPEQESSVSAPSPGEGANS